MCSGLASVRFNLIWGFSRTFEFNALSNGVGILYFCFRKIGERGMMRVGSSGNFFRSKRLVFGLDTLVAKSGPQTGYMSFYKEKES